MVELSQETIDRIRRLKEQRAAKERASVATPMPSLLDVGGTGLRYLDRATRLAGLGIGTAVAANPLTAFYHFIPGVKDWLPDVERVPEAVKAFNKMRQQGDWDAAIEAYQDALNAGPRYWGASEVAASFIPTGGPALAGAKLMSAAPKLAGTLAKTVVPATRGGVRAKRGIEAGLRGAGKVLRAPWEAEEAVGRGAIKGLGFAGRSALHPRTGPMAQAISRLRRPGVEAVEEVPVGLTPEDVAVTDEILRPEFPEPFDIRPVWKGPQPGISNRARLAYQSRPPRDPRVPEGPYTAHGLPEDPRLGGPVFAAREARLAKPVATGKKALVDRVDFEVRMGRLDPEMGRLANRWFAMLPDKYLDNLGSSYVKRIPGELGEQILGEYHPPRIQDVDAVRGILGLPVHGQPSPGIIAIVPKLVRASTNWDRTIIHEVAHHLEDFVSPKDARNLARQWRRDMRSKGSVLVAEIAEIRRKMFDTRLVTKTEIDLINSAYRYEGGFGEWFAEVLTDKALRDLYMEVPAYRNIIQKVIAQVEVLGRAARDFIAEVVGRGDQAERVYKKLISGDYSAVERRSLYTDVRFKAIGQKRDPMAAVPTPTPTAPGAPGVGPSLAARAPMREAAKELAAAGEVPPGMPQLQNMDEAINIATRSNLGRRIANIPGIRNIMKRVNPSAVRNTVEERGLTGLGILRFEAQQKAEQSMAALGRFGPQERVFGKLDDQGLFTEGNLKGLAPNDVRTNWEQLHISHRLNDEQRAWIRTAQEMEEAKLAFLKNSGIEITELTFESGGHYAGRRLMGKFDSDGNLVDWGYAGKGAKGRKLPQEKGRSFRTQKEAIAQGYRYIPEDEALSMNVRAAYSRVAEKKFAEWMINNSPNIRMLGKRGRRVGGEAAIGDVAPDFKRAVFTGPKADEIATLLRQELDPRIRDVDKLLSATAKVNAVGRFMMLNGDASQFLIQLLYMTGARGGLKAWGKGVYGFVRTLGDTTYHKALIDNNRELLARHRGLITSLRGSEYTEAVARGGLLGKGPSFKTIVDPSVSMRTRMAAIAWSPLRLGGKLLDPFGRAFNGAMDTAGIQLAKSMDAALKPKTAAEIADIDAFINEIRGLASSARLGQSATWRSIENNLLLAPRYNRSIAALLWDTVADGGLRGHEARIALGRSLTGLVSIAVGFSIIEHWRDKEREGWTPGGVWDAVMKHITPTSPEFFTWKVGNSNVGPGTKVRSLIKLFAQSYDDPRSLLEISFDHPFSRFARANLAPMASDAADIFSGYTYIGDPTGFRDGWDEESVGENFRKLGTEVILPDIMPIWVHAAALEGGTPLERLVRGAAEFVGGRAYPLKRQQRAEQVAEEKGYGEYETLSARRKAEVDKLVEEELGRRYTTAKGPWYEKVDKADDDFLADIQDTTTAWLSMGPDHKDYSPSTARTEYKSSQARHRVKLYGSWDKEKQRYVGGYYEHLYDMDKEREEPELGTVDHMLWRYRNIIPSVTDANGKIDWEAYDKASSKFWSGLRTEPLELGQQSELDAMLANIRIIEGEFPEEMNTLINAGRYAQTVQVNIDGRSVSFWDIEDLPKVRNSIARDARATRAQVDEYMDATFKRQNELERYSGIYEKIGSALAKAQRTDTGVLGRKKWEFMNKASLTSITWLSAMLAAGYNMPKEVEIGKVLKRRGEYSTITEQPYANLYRNALAQR